MKSYTSLLGAQLLNSLFHFTIDIVIISSTSVTFSPQHILKPSKPGRKLDIFEYQVYSDPKRRVLECVKEYIHRRNDRADRVILTYRKLYHAASLDTLRRWIKETFAEINLIGNFTSRSFTSALVTKAFNTSLDILHIVISIKSWNIEYVLYL